MIPDTLALIGALTLLCIVVGLIGIALLVCEPVPQGKLREGDSFRPDPDKLVLVVAVLGALPWEYLSFA